MCKRQKRPHRFTHCTNVTLYHSFFSKAPPALWPRLCALRSKYCVPGTFSLSLGRNRKNKIFSILRGFLKLEILPSFSSCRCWCLLERKFLSLLFVWGNNWCETAPPLPAHCLIDRLVGRELFQITYLCSCLVLALQPAITGHNRRGEERSRLSSANLALALVPMSILQCLVSSHSVQCPVPSVHAIFPCPVVKIVTKLFTH